MSTDWDTVILATVNASTARRIDAGTLAATLTGVALREPWAAQLGAFFSDAALIAIEGFAHKHGIKPAQLLSACRWLDRTTGEKSTNVERWLIELADLAA